MLSSVNPGRVLPLYSLSFWSRVRPAFLGSSSRVRIAHIAATSSVWGAIFLPRTLPAVVVLLIDVDLVREPGDVGDVDLDRPVPQTPP